MSGVTAPRKSWLASLVNLRRRTHTHVIGLKGKDARLKGKDARLKGKDAMSYFSQPIVDKILMPPGVWQPPGHWSATSCQMPPFEPVPNEIRYTVKLRRAYGGHFGLKLQYNSPDPGGVLYVVGVDCNTPANWYNQKQARKAALEHAFMNGDSVEKVNDLTAVKDGPLKLYAEFCKEGRVDVQMRRVILASTV